MRTTPTSGALRALDAGLASVGRLVGNGIERARRGDLRELAAVSARFAKWRATERIYLPLRRRLSDDGLVRREFDGREMYLDLDDPGLSRRLLVRGRHEPAIAERWEEVLEPGMTVVDVGGNLGYYTLMAADAVGESGRVHSFEPAPDNYELLRRNVELNGYDNVETHDRAVGAEAGTSTMYLTDESNWGTLLDAEEDVVSEYMSEKMDAATEAEIDVETTTLDRFAVERDLDTVDALRMDLEGYEVDVLEGMGDLLADVDPPCWVFLEVHNKLIDDHERVVGGLLEEYVEHGFEPRELVIGSDPVRFDPDEFVETVVSYENCCPHVVLKK